MDEKKDFISDVELICDAFISNLSRHCKILKEYILESSNFKDNLTDWIMKNIEDINEQNSINQEKINYFCREEEDEYLYYIDNIPYLIYHTQIIIIFSFFEDYLNKFCRMFKNLLKLKIGIDDLKGDSNIKICRKFLELVVGIKFEDIQNLWDKIYFYQKMRNNIVHNNLNLISKKNEKDENFLKILKEKEFIKKDEKLNKYYITNYQISIDFLEAINDLLFNIYDRVKKNMNNLDLNN